MRKFIQAEWPAPKAIRAYTTTKCAFAEHPAETPELVDLLNLPSTPIWLNQVHGASVVKATQDNLYQSADAAYTSDTENICAILTADCLPILICNKEAPYTVAAIHGGWRGLAQGIIARTIGSLNLRAHTLMAWLGPAISANHFEVGQDVYEVFAQGYPSTISTFKKSHIEHKWWADLYAIARQQLNSLGITEIYGGNFCTYSQDDLFYSYRRNQKETRRMASLIWIDPHEESRS